jgi:hypothetical protein
MIDELGIVPLADDDCLRRLCLIGRLDVWFTGW